MDDYVVHSTLEYDFLGYIVDNSTRGRFDIENKWVMMGLFSGDKLAGMAIMATLLIKEIKSVNPRHTLVTNNPGSRPSPRTIEEANDYIREEYAEGTLISWNIWDTGELKRIFRDYLLLTRYDPSANVGDINKYQVWISNPKEETSWLVQFDSMDFMEGVKEICRQFQVDSKDYVYGTPIKANRLLSSLLLNRF